MIEVYCPMMKSKGHCSVLVCIYKCPKGRMLKCPEYQRVYPDLLNYPIDPKYTDKYGEVTIQVPIGLRRRRKRREKPEVYGGA